jgi:hypothetical protein
MGAYFEYQSTEEGDKMRRLLEDLRRMAIQFCDEHDVSCRSRKIINHYHFQCKYNPDPIISCYHEDTFQCPNIEQVEKYIACIAAHQIDSLIDKYVAISHEAHAKLVEYQLFYKVLRS